MNYKVISNSLWMISEKFLSVFGTLIVTALTARYLGAEKIGFITYSITLYAFLVPLSSLGAQNIIFDRTSKNRRSGERLIIATDSVRSILFILLAIPFLIYLIYLARSFQETIIVLLLLLYAYYQSKDIYPAYFNATLESRTNVTSNQLSLILSQIFRAILVFINASFFLFAIPYIILTGGAYFLKKIRFKKKTSGIDLKKKSKKAYVKFIVLAGFPLAISSISILIYMRIGQVILAQQIGMAAVGYYNAASTIAQSWVFLPTVAVMMLMNRVLVKREKEDLGFSTVYLYAGLLAIIACIFIYIIGGWALIFAFGNGFKPAEDIVFIISLANMCGIWGLIGYRIIISKGGFKFLMVKAIIISLLNIALSYYLISISGLKGAAYSVLITEFFSATIANYFFNNGYLFKINLKIFKGWKHISHLLR